ncbi:MAG: copper resistance protein CopZ [Rhizobiaceae bacterium]|nr:MAG: copper resistance protein CopZ [Rhizobiaceae bacterium]CAG0984155.1 Copper-binding lipoprotein NosL [Rhizobiaceae bacterium]
MKAKMVLFAALFALAGCSDDTTASIPKAVTMTEEALGHYCQMNLTEHPGPKAQVHLDGLPQPLFFSQVRDAIAYQRMPEQSHAIRTVYVSDMGAPAASWEQPGVDNWILADKALFVVGSRITGGMGAPELVPFSARQKAEAFVAENGGEIRELAQIEDEDVLTPVEFATDADGNFLPPETEQDH